MAVATRGAFRRTRGGLSDVAMTRTDRRRPSSPRSLSINSRTSRPRSPTRQITLTSAVVLRAIMPRTVLLPTPDPAKMPMRWPLPIVSSPSMARMPRLTGSVIRRRVSASGGAAKIGYCLRPRPVQRPQAVGGLRPGRPGRAPAGSRRTVTCCVWPVATTSEPGLMPAISPSGISSRRLALNPTTSALTRRRVAPAVPDLAEFADLRGGADALHDQPDDLRDQPVGPHGVQAGDDGAVAGEVDGGGRPPRPQ